MKKLMLFAVSWLTTASAFATDNQLKVSSVEEQFGKRSEVILKSSQNGVEGKGTIAGKALADGHGAKQSAPSIVKKRAQTHEDNPDFWIYDAWLTLHTDEDYDGYYSHFTVEFDADSVFAQTDVYARLYLSRGEVFEEYHTTSVFSILGESSDDSFLVESELLTGFPPGDYELLIELYDAFDDTLVATFDGYNDVDLTLISLESKTFEERPEQVVVVRESGGSLAFLSLLLLPVLVARISARG